MTAPAANTRKLMAPPLSLRAEVVPTSLDEESRTVDLIWSTGAKGLRHSWWDGPFWEELSMEAEHVRLERLNNGAPLLDSHSGYSVLDVLGTVVKGTARIEAGKGLCTVRLPTTEQAGGDERAEQVFQRLKAGFINNVSVGYRIYKTEKIESADGSAPTHRVIDWEPYEVSLVPMGFDDAARVRSGTRSAGPELNEVEVITRSTTNPHQGTNMTTPNTNAVAEQAAAAERTRIQDITNMVARAGLEPGFAAQFVSARTGVDEARSAIFNEMVSRQSLIDGHHEGRITMGETSEDKSTRAMQAAIIERAGLGGIIRRAIELKAKGLTAADADGGHFRGLSLVEMAREILTLRGVNIRGLDRSRLVGLALTTRMSGMHTTSDFPMLLEGAIGKVLLGSYAVTPDTWSKIAKVEFTADFRASPRYRTGSFGVLDRVLEGGEFKNKSIPDAAKYSIRTETKGNIIAISRQAIVNDDLAALTDLPAKLGRAARLSVEAELYALLAQNSGLGPTMDDSQPFFHSSRNNVNGVGSALSVAGLDADRVVLAAQRDVNNNEPLDLKPYTLAVPSALGATARVLNSSAVNPAGSNNAPNPVQGIVTHVVDTSRLSGTRRYMFVDPNVAPAFVVAMLEGQGDGPVVESDQGWRVDGTELKVRFDFLVQPADPKGAVTNAGA